MNRFVAWCVDNAKAVVVTTVLLAALAGFFAARLELDALPDLTNNQVLVLASAPGLTPEEMERLVARPLEIATAGAPGLTEQRSLSRYGIAAVTLVFEDDVPVYLARQLVTERIAHVELPPGIANVELGPVTGGLGEVFQFTLHSDARSLAELQELAQLQVAPLLKSVPGVVEVNFWGGAQRTFDIVADATRLSQRGLSLRQLEEALRASTGTAAGAALPAGEGQVLLRGQALPLDEAALGAAVVSREARADGLAHVVRVSDVAQVVSGERVRLGAATADGNGEVLYVMAQMLRGANALEVVGRLKDAMPRVRAALPDDVKIDLVYDRSILVRGTLKTVGKNLLEGGLLVIAILFLTLGSWRAGLLVAAAIPLSMLFATATMSVLGIPGNLMSLGAVDFGLLVDGAVVMVEGALSTFAANRAGDARVLVRETSARLARPVFFSVFIIMLVYVPVLALSGTDGKLFRPMALTVVFALAASLVLSLTFIPAAAALFLRHRDVPKREPLLMRLVEHAYPPLLARTAARPLLVAAVALICLVVGGVLLARSGAEFTPQLNEGDLVIQTTRAPDISLAQSVAQATRMERVVRGAAPEVTQVVSRIGSPAVATDIMGLEQADVFVRLAPREAWRSGLTLDGLISEIDAAITREAPGSEPSFTQPIQMRFNELLGGSVTDVAVSVYGEDLVQLATLSLKLKGLLEQEQGAQDVRVLAPPAVPLLTVRPRPLDAANAGLEAADVLETVVAARSGREVGSTWQGVVRIPLMVKQGGIDSAWALRSTPIPLVGGGVVPLERVADVIEESAPGQVNRRNGTRRLMVGFNVRGADLSTLVEHAQKTVAEQLPLPPGVRLEWGGQYESLEAAKRRLAVVVPLVLLSIVIVLLIAFRKIRTVLVLFSHVPFAAIGGLVALSLRQMPISLSAAIGFIALAGVAVLNGVVLLSRIVELEGEGLAPADAATTAAHGRVRPVLMTASVAMFGFVPMMLAQGPGAEVQRPLATVVVGGLFTSTALTLLVLPSLYRFFVPRRAS